MTTAKDFLIEDSLQYVQETVYDHDFIDIETEEVGGYVTFEGKPLIQHLEEIAQGQ